MGRGRGEGEREGAGGLAERKGAGIFWKEHHLGWCKRRGKENARKRARCHRDDAWATSELEPERGARPHSGRGPMRVHSEAAIEDIHDDPGSRTTLDYELHFTSARPRATSNKLLGELTVHGGVADNPIA